MLCRQTQRSEGSSDTQATPGTTSKEGQGPPHSSCRKNHPATATLILDLWPPELGQHSPVVYDALLRQPQATHTLGIWILPRAAWGPCGILNREIIFFFNIFLFI